LPDGRLYFTMKEIKGRSLDTIIWSVHNAVTEGRFHTTADGWSFRRLIDVFHQVCQAVGYAHSKGVLHRDLKPSNIMVGEFGEVLVVDWGIAKVLGRHDLLVEAGKKNVIQSSLENTEMTQIGQVIGTPAYMAPEQARGENDKLGPATDVYALGAMLYKILSGHLAYPGTALLDVLERVRNESPKPISTVLESGRSKSVSHLQLPPELIQACQKAMSRKQEDRFSTAKEFGEVILAWLEGAKKKEQALAIVKQTQPIEAQIKVLNSETRLLYDIAKEGLSGISSWESETVKSQYWQKEAKAKANREEAERLDMKVEQLLQAALTHKSDLEEAHETLVRRYMQTHQLAERDLNVKETAYAEIHLQYHANELPEHNETRHRALHYLKGSGAVSLKTDVSGVNIFLEQYVTHHRRLVPKRIADLGRKPLVEYPLEMGSYRLVLEKEGHHSVNYPVHIGRGEHWDGCDLHGFQRPVHLPKLGDLQAGECFVPGGWFLCGGDHNAFRSYSRRRVWLNDVVMSRFQVTNREYLQFLNALVADGREAEALKWVPMEMAGTVQADGAMLYHRDSSGQFELMKGADGTLWDLDWPVMRISWHSAMAYARWWSEQTGWR
ncbi:MAG: bifunctional serine/threonine-protein kinase/formylglycine-generating enzyme family protein, partial [Myxococcota bacterium]|nr:bifunctional serine/threonine-protein kinase/formylglycine-generating enzyme family protein [Myxococcota bacterium]